MQITIFGLAGTGTSTVGKMLAERLGYRFISTGDMFRKKAKEMGLSLSELHKRIENNPEFDRAFDSEIQKLGEEDNIIVESRLAWYFIPDSIKVRLSCNFETRTKRLAERDGLSFEDAKAHIMGREAVDDKRYKTFYDIEDIDSDGHFDVIIDTTHILPSQIVDRILVLIRKRT